MAGFSRPDLEYSIDPSETSSACGPTQATTEKYSIESPATCSWAPGKSPTSAPKEQVLEPECFELRADVVQWFDVVAVQGVRYGVNTGLRRVLACLPAA